MKQVAYIVAPFCSNHNRSETSNLTLPLLCQSHNLTYVVQGVINVFLGAFTKLRK